MPERTSSELSRKARADLGRMPGDEWVETYGEQLIDALEESRWARLKASRRLVDVSVVIEVVRRSCAVIILAVGSFRRITGWGPRAKKLKATPSRWLAAQAMAAAVEAASRALVTVAESQLMRSVGPNLEPAAGAGSGGLLRPSPVNKGPEDPARAIEDLLRNRN